MFAESYMGRKRCFRMLFAVAELFSLDQLRLRAGQRRSKGLRPHRFRPTYADANVGHPSRPQTFNVIRVTPLRVQSST
jgi:hypothetical protein